MLCSSCSKLCARADTPSPRKSCAANSLSLRKSRSRTRRAPESETAKRRSGETATTYRRLAGSLLLRFVATHAPLQTVPGPFKRAGSRSSGGFFRSLERAEEERNPRRQTILLLSLPRQPADGHVHGLGRRRLVRTLRAGL